MKNLTPIVRAVKRGANDAVYTSSGIVATAIGAVTLYLMQGGNLKTLFDAVLAGHWKDAAYPLVLVAVSAIIAGFHKWTTAKTEPPLR
jgi:hypothetical protein